MNFGYSSRQTVAKAHFGISCRPRAFDVGQSEIAGAVRIWQTRLIDSALVQQFDMRVVEVTDVFDRMDTKALHANWLFK
jgi:hypothetical protein